VIGDICSEPTGEEGGVLVSGSVIDGKFISQRIPNLGREECRQNGTELEEETP
jgi:hypothetical protein